MFANIYTCFPSLSMTRVGRGQWPWFFRRPQQVQGHTPHNWNFIYIPQKLLYLSGWSWFQFSIPVVHLYINHYYGYVALPEVILTCLRNTSDITVAVSLWLAVNLWLAISLWHRAMAAEPRVITLQAHLKRYDANHNSIKMRNKCKIKDWIDVET